MTTAVNMQSKKLFAKVQEFSLPSSTAMDATVAVPTVKGTWKLKYGKHAYYFMNLRTSKGIIVNISHRDIIRPGLSRFKKAICMQGQSLSTLQCLLRRYHYGFNSLEQIMLMTVPHTVTSIGHGRFVINLWSYFGYILVDCRTRTATYHTMEESENDHVLGSQQWFDPQSYDLYSMSYCLKDSFARISDCRRYVFLSC